MKKILFISNYTDDPEVLLNNGVMKKLRTEIVTLQNIGYSVDYILFKKSKIYIVKDNKTEYLTDEYNTYHNSMKNLYRCLKKNNHVRYDYIYSRYDHISLDMIKYFKKAKKNNQSTIIAELPTFSKKWEPDASFKVKIKFIIKRILYYTLSPNVDHIVTFSDDKRIFNIPTINIENFINIESLPLKKESNNKDFIRLIGVAMMTPSHGYDRVINGLYNYYKNNSNQKKVFFDIVGDGSAKKSLESLVQKLGLENYVHFYGLKGGEELNKLFDNADIGVGALAIFRKKCEKASELKLREYTYRGIPFVYSAYEPLFENSPFGYKIENNDSPLDINKLIVFLENYNAKPESMRKFAELNCSCKSQFIKIFKSIE